MIHCYEFYASLVISKPCYFELFSISLGTFDCIVLFLIVPPNAINLLCVSSSLICPFVFALVGTIELIRGPINPNINPTEVHNIANSYMCKTV